MSWRSRLENTQNHAPEDLGMTDLAHQDVGKAMQYIQELEDALQGCTTRMHYKDALQESQKTLHSCGNEWESLSDSNEPLHIQQYHRKIARRIGETLRLIEQVLGRKEG